MLPRSDVESLSRELDMTDVCSRAHGRRLNICLLHLLPPKNTAEVRFVQLLVLVIFLLRTFGTSAEEEQQVGECGGCMESHGCLFLYVLTLFYSPNADQTKGRTDIPMYRSCQHAQHT